MTDIGWFCAASSATADDDQPETLNFYLPLNLEFDKDYDLRNGAAADEADWPLPVLECLCSQPATLAKLRGDTDLLIFCSLRVLRDLARLSHARTFSEDWTLMAERRFHGGRPVIAIERAAPSGNGASATLHASLRAHLTRDPGVSSSVTPPRRYVVRKQTLTFGDRTASIVYAAEVDAVTEDKTKVALKVVELRHAWQEVNPVRPAQAFDIFLRNSLSGCECTLFGCHIAGKLQCVRRFSNEELKYLAEHPTDRHRPMLIDDASRKMKAGLEKIVTKFCENPEERAMILERRKQAPTFDCFTSPRTVVFSEEFARIFFDV